MHIPITVFKKKKKNPKELESLNKKISIKHLESLNKNTQRNDRQAKASRTASELKHCEL